MTVHCILLVSSQAVSIHIGLAHCMLQMRASMACHQDPALGEMYALVRSQGLLESRLRALAHQVSDANLQQMPDFQQRVEVLRQMEYIALDNTVQLKVAVRVVSGTCIMGYAITMTTTAVPFYYTSCSAMHAQRHLRV